MEVHGWWQATVIGVVVLLDGASGIVEVSTEPG